MSEPTAYEYAILRIVPDEARGEFINAGVILYCAEQRWLKVRTAFDGERLAKFAPQADAQHLREHLAALEAVGAGGKKAGALGELSAAERFRWLTSPRNTLIQPSPVHSGLTTDPEATLANLVETLVRHTT